VAKLAEEESAQPPAQRRTSAARAAAGAGAGAGRFAFSIAPATYLHIVLATLDPAAGGYLQLFITQAVGGTTYEDPPTTTTNPGTHMLVATLNLLDTSSAKRVQSAWFRLPPSKIKFVLYNGAGVALNATGNTVTLYTGNDEVQ